MRVPEEMMSERQTLWVEEMCRLLAPIERETLEKLGEEKGGFFIRVADDSPKSTTSIGGRSSFIWKGRPDGWRPGRRCR
jgi:hypothetical protein